MWALGGAALPMCMVEGGSAWIGDPWKVLYFHIALYVMRLHRILQNGTQFHDALPSQGLGKAHLLELKWGGCPMR